MIEGWDLQCNRIYGKSPEGLSGKLDSKNPGLRNLALSTYQTVVGGTAAEMSGQVEAAFGAVLFDKAGPTRTTSVSMPEVHFSSSSFIPNDMKMPH